MPPRLQAFLMRALKYDVTVNCVKGPDVPIADALSRVSPQLAPSNGELPEICVHHITQYLPASPTKLQQIRDETGKDPTVTLLKEVVLGGWPQKREKFPQSSSKSAKKPKKTHTLLFCPTEPLP